MNDKSPKASYQRLPTKTLGSAEVPYFRTIINHAFDSFEACAKLIDKLPAQSREWDKIGILANTPDYINFLALLSNISSTQVVSILNEFHRDGNFRKTWEPVLAEFDRELHGVGGDIRFNSLSLYVLVRAFKPEIMIETGVASGKSSAIILLAMHHNKCGHLYSVDLPNADGQVLGDGGVTTTRHKPVGWLVPEYLGVRWTLKLGDSLQLLPSILKELKQPVDIFFHDSLHTYSHTRGELELAWNFLNRKKALVLVDDIDVESGYAFHEVLEAKEKVGHGYRELAGVYLG